MKNQYIVFYHHYGFPDKILHYSFDIEVQESADLTMSEIYSALKNYLDGMRFVITSITKLN